MHHKPYTLPLFLTAAIFTMTHEINILLMSTAFNTSKSYKRVWIAKCSESGINLSVEPYSEERGSAVFWLLHFLSLLLDGVSFLLSPGCSNSDVILNDFHSKLGRIHIKVFSPHMRGKHLFGIMGCTCYLCLVCRTRVRGCVYTTTCIQ